jgi:lipoprotein signal peptidase
LTLTFIYTGGMFNAIQRSIPYTIISMPDQDTTNAALDYFKFNFNWGIFNFPDAFVVTGTICFSLSLILEMIVNIAKENKKPKEIK